MDHGSLKNYNVPLDYQSDDDTIPLNPNINISSTPPLSGQRYDPTSLSRPASSISFASTSTFLGRTASSTSSQRQPKNIPLTFFPEPKVNTRRVHTQTDVVPIYLAACQSTQTEFEVSPSALTEINTQLQSIQRQLSKSSTPQVKFSDFDTIIDDQLQSIQHQFDNQLQSIRHQLSTSSKPKPTKCTYFVPIYLIGILLIILQVVILIMMFQKN